MSEGTLVLRFKNKENLKYIYSIMAQTDQRMCDIVEMMVVHCKDNKFSVPQREMALADKQFKARKERHKRYSKLASS